MHRNKWKWEHNNSKPMRFSKSSAKREVHSNTCLPQETRETSDNQPNFTPKTTRKRRTELQNRRKEIIKIRADIREKKWWRL